MARYDGNYTSGVIIDKPDERVEFTRRSTVSDPTFALSIATTATAADVVVAGQLSAGTYGLYASADDCRIATAGTGTIDANTAVLLTGADQSFSNNGKITADTYGLIAEGERTEISNAGLISAPIGMSVASALNPYVVNQSGGRIVAETIGVLLGSTTQASSEFVNRGSIEAVQYAIIGDDYEDRVTNRGEIVGNIDLGLGNDRYDGRKGTLSGILNGGDGNDIYQLDDNGIELVEGQNRGFDSVYASTDFQLPANVEILYLLGRKDLDGDGNDGDDHLIGNAGDNVLNGHEGSNVLVGYGGSDLLIGGSGEDEFCFASTFGRDAIANFQDGVDILNIREWRDLSSFEDVLDHARERDGNVVISSGEDRLTIENFTLGQMDPDDFAI